jgi:hypothetical protein
VSRGHALRAGLLLATLLSACGRVGYDPLLLFDAEEGELPAAPRVDARAPSPDARVTPSPEASVLEVPAPAPDARPVQGPLLGIDAPPEVRPVDASAPVDAGVDSASRDLGPADAPADGVASAPPDAAAPATYCLSRRSTALYCEDFESGLPAAVGGLTHHRTAGAQLEATTRRRYRGERALRAYTPAAPMTTSDGPTGLATLARRFAAVTGVRLHARAHVYVPGNFDVVHWLVLLQLQSPSTSKISFDVVAEDRVQLAVTPVPLWVDSAPRQAPRDRWACVELAVLLDRQGGAGFAELFIDGVSRLRTPTGTTTLPQGGFEEVAFGVQVRNATGAVELFFDDVVVDTRPIGCD